MLIKIYLMVIADDLNEVAARIKQFRRSRSLSQMDLAYKADISQSFLANIELSKKMPTIQTVLKIASALDINPGDFFPTKKKNRGQIIQEIQILLEQLR